MFRPSRFRSFALTLLLLIGSLSLMPTVPAAQSRAMTTPSEGMVQPAKASASPTSLQSGMTWTVLEQQNGYVHVGADGQTNPYAGDTAIDRFLPILCLLVDGRSAPSDISFDYF